MKIEKHLNSRCAYDDRINANGRRNRYTADKATVGTFISKIDWGKSESLNELFLPFKRLGEEKHNLNGYYLEEKHKIRLIYIEETHIL